MRLDRYLSSLYAGAVLLSLSSLVMLVVAAQFLEGASNFNTVEGGAESALELSLLVGVEYGFQILPVAVFLGVLVAGTVLARRGELLAMQAGGMSTWRQALPMGLVVLGIVVAAVVGGDTVIPKALERAETIRLEKLRKPSALHRFFSRRAHWFKHDEWMLHLPLVDTQTGTFRSPTIYRVTGGEIREVMTAKVLEYQEKRWVLSDVEVYRPSDMEVERLATFELALAARPEDLRGVAGNPRHLSRSEIQLLVQRRERAGMDSTAHRLEVHQRVAQPCAALWMFLLALPWALMPDRRRSMAVVLGAGVVAVAVLLSCMHILRMLALSDQITPFWGAWGMGLLGLGVLPANQWLVDRYRSRGTVF